MSKLEKPHEQNKFIFKGKQSCETLPNDFSRQTTEI